jgi:maltooligosyltrehalose trehalohydrolase
MGDGAPLRLTANLSNSEIAHSPDETMSTQIWGGGTGKAMPPWSVLWHLGAR